MQIGVCGWCIDRHDATRSIEVASKELNLPHVQIGLFTEADAQAADGEELASAARACGATLVGTFAAFESEDYSSIQRVAATGGLLPDEHYTRRFKTIASVAGIAAASGCDNVGIHLGTIPADTGSCDGATLLARGREVADRLAEQGLRLLLETGREPAEVLVAFLDALKRDNVAVSFDPANFVTYGTDDPVRAVRALRGRIALVHVKDAQPPTVPDRLGRKAALGAGTVEIPRIISKLRATGYAGPLLIEVPAQNGDLDPIRHAAGYLRSLFA